MSAVNEHTRASVTHAHPFYTRAPVTHTRTCYTRAHVFLSIFPKKSSKIVLFFLILTKLCLPNLNSANFPLKLITSFLYFYII